MPAQQLLVAILLSDERERRGQVRAEGPKGQCRGPGALGELYLLEGPGPHKGQQHQRPAQRSAPVLGAQSTRGRSPRRAGGPVPMHRFHPLNDKQGSAAEGKGHWKITSCN